MRSPIFWLVTLLAVAIFFWIRPFEESARPGGGIDAPGLEAGEAIQVPSAGITASSDTDLSTSFPAGEASQGSVPQASRQAVGNSQGLRLVDAQGDPVGGLAFRLWDLSLDTGDILGFLGTVSACDRLYLEPDRTSRIADAAMTWVSESDGSLALDPEVLPADRRLLAAIIEPGWLPWWVVLDSSEQLLNLGEVELQDSGGCRVAVHGVHSAGGEVRVVAQAMLPEGAVPESLAPEIRSRRALFHAAVLPADGTLRVPRFDGRVALWAWQGDLRSEVFIGEQGSELTLTLQPTFSVSGTVKRESGEPVGAYAHVVASRWDPVRRVWEPQATAMVGEGGRYGPLALLASPKQRHRLSVRWTEAGEADRELGSPAAGVQLTEDFLLGPNRDVWVHVWGSVPEQEDVVELPGARVLARWTRPSGGEFLRDKTTIASGWVRFGGIEPGDVVMFTASAEGYATSSGHTFNMTEAGIDPFNLVLQPAASRAVRVTHRGEPVEECLFVRSNKDGYESASATWLRSTSEPGRFSLPPSEWVAWIRAVLPGVGASRSVRFEPADGVAPSEPIELVILDGPIAGGQVVDGASGEPIAGAQVGLIEPYRGGGTLANAAVEAFSREGGLFELRGLPPESREHELLVKSEGYRLLRQPLPVLEVESGRVDLGRLELAPALQLSLDVLERSGSVGGFSVWGTGLSSIEKRAVRPGERLTWTLIDDSSDLQVFFDGAYGQVWDWIGVSARGRAGEGLVVTYDPPLAGPLETGARAPADWLEDSSLWPLRLMFYPEDPAVGWNREVRLPGPVDRVLQPALPPGGYQVHAMSAAGGELARIEWRLDPGVQGVELPFDESGRRLQLARLDGAEVEGAKVLLDSGSDVGLLSPATATAEGWLEPRLHFEPSSASGVLPRGECFTEVDVAWSGADQGESVGFIEVGPFVPGTCLCEAAGGPLGDVEWQLHPKTWKTVLGSGKSAADGYLQLPPMMTGTYRLELNSPGYWPRAVAVEAGARDLRLWMARRSALRVRLLTPDGSPLVNEPVSFLHVELNAGSDYWIARGLLESSALTSGGDGSITIDGLPEGTYRFSARDGGWSGEAEQLFTAGAAVDVQLTDR